MAEIATIASIATAAAGAASAGVAAYGAGQQKKMAAKAGNMPAPQPQEAPRMPDADDPRVKEERERRIRERQMSGGRDSTNLSPGGDYSGTVLGS